MWISAVSERRPRQKGEANINSRNSMSRWSEVIRGCLSGWLFNDEIYGYPDDADDVQ